MNFRLNWRPLGLAQDWRPWTVVGTLAAMGVLVGVAQRWQPAAPGDRPLPQITEAFGGPLWVVVLGEKKPLTVGQSLPPQTNLVLESGRLQVTWPDGTLARLEGPTEWRLEDSNQATLRDGRMLVMPPPDRESAKQWQFPGGRAVVAPGGTLFVDVARDRTVRLVQLEGESRVFRPDARLEEGDRPELRLGSASQLTVRADGRWEIPTFLVPGAIARLMGSTVLLEGFARKLEPLALREAPAPPRPAVSVRPTAPAPVLAPPPRVAPPVGSSAAAVTESAPPPEPVDFAREPPRLLEPVYREPKVPPLVPSSTMNLPEPQFAPPVLEPLPVESPEMPKAAAPLNPVDLELPPSESAFTEPPATETF